MYGTGNFVSCLPVFFLKFYVPILEFGMIPQATVVNETALAGEGFSYFLFDPFYTKDSSVTTEVRLAQDLHRNIIKICKIVKVVCRKIETDFPRDIREIMYSGSLRKTNE